MKTTDFYKVISKALIDAEMTIDELSEKVSCSEKRFGKDHIEDMLNGHDPVSMLFLKRTMDLLGFSLIGNDNYILDESISLVKFAFKANDKYHGEVSEIE